MKPIKFLLFFILAIFASVGFQSFALADNGDIEKIKKDADVKKIIFLDTSINIANSTVEKLIKVEIKHKLKKYFMDMNMDMDRQYNIFDSDSRSKFNKHMKDNQENEYFILATDVIIECTYDVYKVVNEFDIIVGFFDKNTQKKIKKHGRDVYQAKINLNGFIINSLSSVSGDLIISEKEYQEDVSNCCTQIIVSSKYRYLSRNIPAKNWIRSKINEKVDLNLNKFFN